MAAIGEYVGQKIRQLREAKGLTQVQLAVKIKVTPNTVSRWESGTYKPSIEDLERLARTLEKPIWAFFPGELRPEKPPTKSQEILLSATGDLPAEDLEELARYVEFVRARKVWRRAGRRGSKGGTT